MRGLSDIMSHAGLGGYAEVALILFLLAFLVIVLRIFAPSRRREMDEMARKPLEDDASPSRPGTRP